MTVKIPGLSHEFNSDMIQGKNYLVLSIKKGNYVDELSKAVIYSHSAKDVEGAIVECLRKADVIHQVPNNVIQQLTDNVMTDGGFKSQKDIYLEKKEVSEREFQTELTKLLSHIQKDGETFRLDLTKKVNQITFDSTEVSTNLDRISREQSIVKDDVNSLTADIQTLKEEMANFVKTSEENFKKMWSRKLSNFRKARK